MRSRRQSDTSAAAVSRIGRLEAALRALADDTTVPPWIRTLAAGALVDPRHTTAAHSTDWAQCRRCGEAYYGGRCVHKDKACPMEGP